MNRLALRYLSLGFFLSAVLLAGYMLLSQSFPAEEQSKEEQKLAEQTALANSYKQKYEELLAEMEITQLNEKLAGTATTSDTETEPVEQYGTVVIAEGSPSSLAGDQLEKQGIIDDAHEFNSYLTENGYSTQLRPGVYELSGDMDFEQIAFLLMDRN